MKLKFMLIIPIFVSMTLSSLNAKDVSVKYTVDGMMCSSNCPGKVNEALKGMDGIKSCNVDFETKTATVIYNDTVLDPKLIAETITKATYYKVEEKKVKQKSMSFWERVFGKG